MKKFIRVITCVALLVATMVVVGVDLLKNQMNIPEDNLWGKLLSQESEKEGSELPEGLETSEKLDEAAQMVMTEEDKTYSMHEKVECQNSVHLEGEWYVTPLLLEVTDFEITKTLPSELPVVQRMTEWWGMNSDGSFSNNYNYIVVRLRIMNETDYEQEYWLNSFQLDLKDENGKWIDGGEVWLYNNKDKTDKKDYFSCIHPPHSEQDFTIAFVKTDEELAKATTIKLEISNWGIGPNPHNLERYVTLQSKE